MKESGWKFFFLTKWQLWELRQLLPYMAFVYAWIVPLWADQLLPQLLMEQFVLCRYNVDTLNICMKECIIFVCTDSTAIFLSKLRSAGLNYNLPSFFTNFYCAGVSNKHCLLTFFIFFLSCAMPLCGSVYMCLVVTCWERADLLALFCGVQLWVCHFPTGILGQVWYLIVLIPDLCTQTYFHEHLITCYWQQSFLNQRKKENDHRNHFMITLNESIRRMAENGFDPPPP